MLVEEDVIAKAVLFMLEKHHRVFNTFTVCALVKEALHASSVWQSILITTLNIVKYFITQRLRTD